MVDVANALQGESKEIDNNEIIANVVDDGDDDVAGESYSISCKQAKIENFNAMCNLLYCWLIHCR